MRSGLDGAPQEYGLCAECDTSPRHLDRRAVAEVLGPDPTVDALAGITVERFADRPQARADRPNERPWAHLDVAALAAEVDANRHDIERRTGGPCHWCGTTLTPEGTSWHRMTGDDSQCDGCFERFGGHWSNMKPSQTPMPDGPIFHDPARDAAATILCGLEAADGTGVRRVRRDLGRQVGLLWWNETKDRKGADHPFAHVDLAAMRRRAAELIDAGTIGPPPPPKSDWPHSIPKVVRW